MSERSLLTDGDRFAAIEERLDAMTELLVSLAEAVKTLNAIAQGELEEEA